jgi:hypothetical protein
MISASINGKSGCAQSSVDPYTKTRINAARQMHAFDTDKLTAILNAAQSPTFKKLLEDHAKAKKVLAEATVNLAELETKLFSSIPPALKGLLEPSEAKIKKPKSVNGNGNGDLKKPDLQELKSILDALPDKTLNIRGEGYDTPNIKILAAANPHLFAYEKGAWPKVRYLR